MGHALKMKQYFNDMARITQALLQFNESIKYSEVHERLLEFLDEYLPQWRAFIKNRDEWLPFFEQEVKVIPWSKQQLAAKLFDIIDNQDALVAVWNDTRCSDHYRLTAIRRLREIDESTYLPQYIDWFKNARLDVSYDWFAENLFDFDGALEVALDMATKRKASYQEEQIGKSYLALNSNQWWDKYPAKAKEEVLHHNYYQMIEVCDESLWGKLSEDERAFLTAGIRIASVTCPNPFLKNYLKGD